MRLLVCVAALMLSGCASYEPRPNPWDDVELLEQADPPARPIELPAWPDPELMEGGILIDAAGAQTLLQYKAIAEGNTAAAAAQADQVEALRQSHDALVRAGQAEHELAETWHQLLEEERRARLWDKLSVWSILAGLGIRNLVR